jgi:outer membrane biogenesis lipoprotein LolB
MKVVKNSVVLLCILGVLSAILAGCSSKTPTESKEDTETAATS